jgi:hypothetical protein
MRENRQYGSEGGEAKSLPYPYRREIYPLGALRPAVQPIEQENTTYAKRGFAGGDGIAYRKVQSRRAGLGHGRQWIPGGIVRS